MFQVIVVGSSIDKYSMPCLYAANHRLRDRFPYGHTFAASTSRYLSDLIFFSTMGSTHLRHSSLMVFDTDMTISPF